MAKKITIQHLYTTSGTTAPTGLTNGEIAISHTPENEAIFLKPRQEAGKAAEEIKFIPEVRIKKMFEEAGIGSNDVITGLSSQLNMHIGTSGDTGIFGHVQLVSGNVQNITEYKVGLAASPYHTHGQYLEENSLNKDKGFQMSPGLNGGPNSYGVKAGAGITVDANGVSINDEYQGKIASGVTAYGWGNHAEKGYAKNDDLTALRNSVTAHTGNTEIHVRVEDKNAWNKAKSDIDAFMIAAESGNTALDTLKEIQDFLTSDKGTVQTLLDNFSVLTDTVSGNTDDIASLKQNFEGNGTVTVLQNDVQRKVETIDVSGNLSAVTGTTSIGNYKKYTITHTTAGTQASEITATNTTTGLSFGSEFKIVDKIGYDANGHVVTGSTQTLKLPTIPAATISTTGVVSLKGGDLSTVATVVNGQAAASCHSHSQYVKFTDLSNNPNSDSIIISCGTY